MFAVVFFVVVALCASAGCMAKSPIDPAPEKVESTIELEHTAVALPTTTGTFVTLASYVQVSGITGLDKVNDVLKALVTNDQQVTIASYAKIDAGTVRYHVAVDPALISGSSKIVSLLMPVDVDPSDGVGGSYWLAATMSVPTAQPVQLVDLFVSPLSAVTTLTRLAKAHVRTETSDCFRDSLDEEFASTRVWSELSTFGTFALLPAGLVIGFSKYQIAPGACSATKVLIPWVELADAMTESANHLVSDLR